MAYKDKEKAREASRERQRRYKAKQKALLNKGVTGKALHKLVDVMKAIPNYGQPDCECRHCQTNRANGNKYVINHGSYKPAHLLGRNELNRVSLPGDPDYDGVCLDAKYEAHRYRGQ